MKRLSIHTILFIGILLLALFFRLYQIESVPPAPSVDEVSTGYNAYSLLKAGKGEHGRFLPLILQSYDDWQPALYAYLVIPFILLFDLSVLAVRLPSVTLSLIAVFITYLSVKEIFTHDKNREWYALATAFLLAISPWHIYLSRLGFPSNAGLGFFLLFVYFLIRKRLYIAMVFFVLSAMSYHTEKIFLPVILASLLIIYRKYIITHFKKVSMVLLLGAILLFPFLQQSLSPGALSRFGATSILTAKVSDRERDLHLNLAQVRAQSFISRILYRENVVSMQYALRGYFSHFSPVWLFTNITAAQHKAPAMGLLYPWEAVTILAGMIVFFSSKLDRKKKIFVSVWFLAAPLAGAITTNAPHAVRSEVFLPLWQLFSGIGLVTITVYFIRTFSKIITISIVTLLLSVSVLLFYNQYFIVFPFTQSNSFQYALSQALPYVFQKEAQYDKVVFANDNALYQSYMYYLFYRKYDPILYQQQGGTAEAGYDSEHHIGKYTFNSLQWEKEKTTKQHVLYVGTVNDFSDTRGMVKDFSDLDGTPEIRIMNTPL